MDFYEVVEKRRSIRKFSADMPPADVITRILHAGRLAPTWANRQGCRYVVVQDPVKVDLIKNGTGQNWVKTAPMFIVVAIDPKGSGTSKHGIEYYTVDAGICTEQLLLAIAAEGLGSTFMGYFNEQAIKAALRIPEKTRVIAVLPVGYPAAEPTPLDRKSLAEICFLDEFGIFWPNAE